jgi:beta-fructofuranosidase
MVWRLGVNWEVTTFLTLVNDSGGSMEFLFMGSEGPKPRQSSHSSEHNSVRMSRSQLWMSGSFRTCQDETGQSNEVKMAYEFGGILDHGCYYAANVFQDPRINQTVVFGWSAEDDLDDSLRLRQGWSGALTLPASLVFRLSAELSSQERQN